MHESRRNQAWQADDQLNTLTTYVINEWLATRAKGKADILPYWPFCDDIAVTDGIAMKGRRIIVPSFLQ